MSENKNDQVVIALFEDENFANYAIDLLKKWEYITDGIKLGAVGIISKKDGKVKTHVTHKTGGGAKLGAILGLIAAVLSGGTSWLVGVVGGTALGGITGSFFKKSLHLTKEEVEALGSELERGRVAVVITCDVDEVEPLSQQITAYGGDLTTYAVPADALDEATEALVASGEVVDDDAPSPSDAPVAAADVATNSEESNT